MELTPGRERNLPMDQHVGVASPGRAWEKWLSAGLSGRSAKSDVEESSALFKGDIERERIPRLNCCQTPVGPKSSGMENMCRTIAFLAVVWFQLTARPADLREPKSGSSQPYSDYRLTDLELKMVGVDSDPSESFLALELDSAGRLFAGGREALFVYEPAKGEMYQPRQLLFRFPKDSWIYGIAIRGPDLYVSTHTAIYVLEGAVLKRADIKPKRLLWGLPMLPYFEEHQGMHALAFGPDGDLYFSLGDNLVGYGDFKRADHWGHWTFLHGNAQTPVTTVGLVGRISPDGASCVPLARGIRNCCGLAFDANWNLFGNDNDHESLPNEYVPGRLLNITPHAYFSWPRGWMPEKKPWRTDLLDTLNPDLGRYVPTGQAYYNDPLLPEKFRDNLLVAEWGKGSLFRYPLTPSGAAFKAVQYPLLTCTNNMRPVGVAVGRGGRIFVSSLAMAGNEASPVSRSEIIMVTRADDSPDAPFAGFGETTVSKDRLFAELADSSWHRRYRAHIELSRRGPEIGRDAASRLSSAPTGSSLETSLLWLAAAGGATKEIEPYASSINGNTRWQAIRALSRFGSKNAICDILEKAIADSSPQVAHAALIGLFDRCDQFPREPVFRLAESDDSFLRQTAVQLLAEKASVPELQQLSESTRSQARLAGVLALGFRLTVPPAAKPLLDNFPLNAKGFNAKVQYVGGVENLATNARLGVFTIADAWSQRARTEEEETIFAMLSRRMDDADTRVARQAAFFLRLLKDERVDAKAAALLDIDSTAQTNAPIANARVSGAVELPEMFRNFNWQKESERGDIKKGQELFTGRGCAVCHQISPQDKGGGGPSLAGAGSRFNAAYLVESVMTPNKTVAPMFRWTLVQLKDDEDIAGLVTGETSDEIDLLLPAGVHRTIKKSAIAKREIQDRSPMPEGLIQTPAELRDLLAFLLSEK
jgi:putative heme-binding domain-containing protein